MNLNFKNLPYNKIAIVLGAFAIAKMIWIAIETKLPLDGVNIANNSTKNLYYRYTLAPEKIKYKRVSKPVSTIRSYRLIGIYISPDDEFAIITKGGEQNIIRVGESIGGYELLRVEDDKVYLSRDGKEYILKLESNKEQLQRHYKIVNPVKKHKISKADVIKDSDGIKVVSKSMIQEYTKNMDKIWNNISIAPYKRGGKLNGFKIKYIRRGSIFEKLGLKKGDIITEINGVSLDNMTKPMRIMSEIGNIEHLSIIVLRGENEEELEYEIQ